jgi:hypothetical protein
MTALASHLIDELVVALAIGKSGLAGAGICIRWDPTVEAIA